MSNHNFSEDYNIRAEKCAKSVLLHENTKDLLERLKNEDKQRKYNYWLQKARKNSLVDRKKSANNSNSESSEENRPKSCDNEMILDKLKASGEKTSSRDLFIDELKNENAILRKILLSKQCEEKEMGKLLSQLQFQLGKLIAQYKTLKRKNCVLTEKLDDLEKSEKVEKVFLEEKKEKIEKTGRERSQSKSGTEESIDEGYADGSLVTCLVSTPLTSLPSPPLLDPDLLSTISGLILESRNFFKPIEEGLDVLTKKLNNFPQDTFSQFDQLSLDGNYRNERFDLFAEKNYNSI